MEYHDEHDTIIFEDFKLKFFNEDENDEVIIEELDDEFLNKNFENISTIHELMKEHVIYAQTKYFDKIKLSDFNDYFEDAYFDESHGLEINQEVPEILEIKFKIKNPNIYEWVGMNLQDLKISYSYLKRLSKNHNLQNGSFYAFCQLGFETSTM